MTLKTLIIGLEEAILESEDISFLGRYYERFAQFFTRKKKLFLESVRKWPGERRLSPLRMASCFWQLSLLTLCSLQCALLASLSHSLNNNSRVQLILFQFYICEHSNFLYVWFFLAVRLIWQICWNWELQVKVGRMERRIRLLYKRWSPRSRWFPFF